MNYFYTGMSPNDGLITMGCRPIFQVVALEPSHSGLARGELLYKNASGQYERITSDAQITCENNLRVVSETVPSGTNEATTYAKGEFAKAMIICPLELSLHIDTLAKLDIVIM